jgi:hypothetical protein
MSVLGPAEMYKDRTLLGVYVLCSRKAYIYGVVYIQLIRLLPIDCNSLNLLGESESVLSASICVLIQKRVSRLREW